MDQNTKDIKNIKEKFFNNKKKDAEVEKTFKDISMEDLDITFPEEIEEPEKCKTCKCPLKNYVLETKPKEELEKPVEVIGVRFKSAGKIYYYNPEGETITNDEAVIVETIRGIEYGDVEVGNHFVEDKDIVKPLKSIIRVATKEDKDRVIENQQKADDSYEITREKIAKHGLEMKLIDIEMTFDQSKIIFYFTADGRVDFRELVKDLAYIFKIRIELRQVGVRDEAKIMDGIGICGRQLCCSTFLDEFEPVSIRMAKEQGLSLNPSKISGICGRLMCCLQYEEENYKYFNAKMPNVGQRVKTVDGTGEILSMNVLREQVRVAIRENPDDPPQIDMYHVDDIEVVKYKPKRQHQNQNQQQNQKQHNNQQQNNQNNNQKNQSDKEG